MDEKIFIISDIEMGRGDITDDFSDDDAVTNFLERISAKNPNDKITLVLNGDIFDFLKMSYKETYPVHITEEISLWKLEEIFRAHARVFKAFKKFLRDEKHFIHFVIGNHDVDLAWPGVQARLKAELANSDRVTFDYSYSNKEIHAEHGHLQDTFFKHDTQRPITEYRGKRVLNLPWGSHAIFSHLVQLKRKFPREERLVPKPLALKKNRKFEKESKRIVLNLILRSLLNPFLRLFDPTYRTPIMDFIKHTFRYGLKYVDDELFIKDWTEEVIKAHPEKKIIVLGHAHVLTDMERQHRKIFVTDTWRNETDIRKNLRKKPKSFVEISYREGELLTARMETMDEPF